MTSPHAPENTSLNSSEGIGMSNSTEMSSGLLKLLDRWDDLNGAIDRVVTALPEQMSAAAAELIAQRKLMREEFNQFTRATRNAALSPEDEGSQRK